MDKKYTYLRGLVIGLIFAFVVVITLVALLPPLILVPAYIVYSAIQWFKKRREYALGLLTVVFGFIAACIVIAIVHLIITKL
jgi:hypothetical protein